MIGFFDSGSGGLTIMRACRAALTHEQFLYLGDHRNAPYGDRPNLEILELTRQGAERLFGAGCELVILACNTAAAVALRTLQQHWLPRYYPDRRILGVLVPMVEAMTDVPWHRETPTAASALKAETVAIFATRKTVETGAYVEEVRKRAPAATVIQIACPGLVDAIEAGAGKAVLLPMIRGFAAEAHTHAGGRTIDAAVLGCTHYPLVEDLFAQALPAGTRILSQPRIVADALSGYLERHPRFRKNDGPGVRYLTTGPAGSLAGMELFVPEVKGRIEYVS